MRVQVRGKRVEVSVPVRTRVERRLQFALGRFAPRIASVGVRLEDVNGPRRGIDKLCRVRVRGVRGWQVIIEEADADLGAAIDRAADRAGRAVARSLERRRRAGARAARAVGGRRAPGGSGARTER